MIFNILNATQMKSKILASLPYVECLAIVIGVVIACFALVVAEKQISSSNASQKEATAQQAYSEYLKLAIEHPNLAAGLRDSKGVNSKEKNKPTNKEEDEKYAWFVSYFLNSGEQIFISTKGDKAWEHTLKLQVCNHKKFFLSKDWNQDLKDSFDPSYITLIESGIEWCGLKSNE